jgi:CDGSH-type Zn-finger protein|tara:strand:+ start:117 stop:257 length:141 start_codon:yes stop_codon:yes gene_type:complete
MNLSTRSTSKNAKNRIIESNSSERGKCQCGKTKDADGNCDGSHTKK